MQYSKIFSVVALLVASATAAPLCAPGVPGAPSVPGAPGAPTVPPHTGSDGFPGPAHGGDGAKICSNEQYSQLACYTDSKYNFISNVADCVPINGQIATVKCCAATNDQEVEQNGLINVAAPINVQCVQALF